MRSVLRFIISWKKCALQPRQDQRQHLRIACSATCFNLAAAVRIVASWKVFRLEVRGVRIFAMVGRFNVYDGADQEKMRSQLAAHLKPFLWLIACMVTLCDKKYSVLTFHTKTELYLIFCNKSMLNHAEYLRPSRDGR